LKNLAVAAGMQTLEQVAMAKVRSGITTLEEMHRVLIVGA
jgi:type II secretory ATPase GspE/PulE/Tfp pilus assembly ATPase PilB-like protein